jgi:MFS family permease
VLGFFTPSFGVMLVFLFINSMGMHLFMPLQDSIGMALAEPGQVGRRMGQYASIKTAMGFVAGIIVFFGFRYGLFSFHAPIKYVFLLGSCAFLIAMAASLLLSRHVNPMPTGRKRIKLVFRKEYRYYYFLTVLNGVQKQIAFVFGTWVLVDLLRKGADTMSLLMICASFLGTFFMRFVGRWMDRYGIKRMMYADALSFIGVYVVYGFVVWGISSGAFPKAGWPVALIFGLFVSDRLSMQLGVVKAIYLRSIAVNKEEVTATLSTGISLDHTVAILAAQLSGAVWTFWGPQWVFFIAAFLSLGNLFVAWKLPTEKNGVAAEAVAAEG